MSVLLAAILLASQPAAPVQTGVPAAQKQKPQQICEMVEITGSRAKRRVCRNASGNLDLGPGVSNSLGAKATIDQGNGQATAPGGQ